MTKENFKLMRQQRGYTQASFAKKIGYSRTQVGAFERGEYPVPEIVALVITLLPNV